MFKAIKKFHEEWKPTDHLGAQKDNEKAEANRKAMLAQGIIPGNYRGKPENFNPDYKRRRKAKPSRYNHSIG